MMLTDTEKWRELCKPLSVRELRNAMEKMRNVHEIVRSIYAQKQKEEIREVYSAGDVVTFSARGNKHRGIVTNLNETTLSVKVGRTKWHVAPRLVTKLRRRQQ